MIASTAAAASALPFVAVDRTACHDSTCATCAVSAFLSVSIIFTLRPTYREPFPDNHDFSRFHYRVKDYLTGIFAKKHEAAYLTDETILLILPPLPRMSLGQVGERDEEDSLH